MQINFIDIFLSTTEKTHIRLLAHILNVEAWYAGGKKARGTRGGIPDPLHCPGNWPPEHPILSSYNSFLCYDY